MAKSILRRESHLSSLATILIMTEEYPLSREICRGSDDFESLPLDLVDLIVLGVWKMIERRYLLE